MIRLWNDAEQVTIGGIRVYAFGLYAAAGALLALTVIMVGCRRREARQGTGTLMGLLSLILGAACSRIAFCLLNQELGNMMPPASWIQITGGGWSFMGLIGGALLAGWICARLTRFPVGDALDVEALALPLFFTAERAGEGMIPDFDLSRTLDSEWLSRTFLAVNDEYGAYIATWKVAAAFSAFLFVILVLYSRKSRRPGDVCVAFLLLFGAGSIVLESLRYDRFLSITFVGLQQILAACMLGAGVISAVLRNRAASTGRKAAAILALILAVGIVLGLEFALDRTTINKFLIYGVMIATVLLPAGLSLRLQRRAKKGA